MHQEFNKLFNALAGTLAQQLEFTTPSTSSGYTDKGYSVVMDTPRVKKDTIKVSIEDDHLVFRASVTTPKFEGEAHMDDQPAKDYRRSLYFGRLNAVSTEGRKVDIRGKIKVSVDNGTTTILIPYKEVKAADFEIT
jgi:HSP20 family molecular chaperone IbpA